MRRFGKRHGAHLRDQGAVRPQLLALLLAVLIVAIPGFGPGPGRLMQFGQDVVQPSRSQGLPIQIQHADLLNASDTLPNNGNAAGVDTTDCRQQICLALTFDDGPNPLTTPQILTELEQAHIPATFFLVGNRVAGNEGLLRRMAADGDEIGNHSWSHPDMTKIPPQAVQQQIQLTQNAVTAAGVPPPTVFRPPYGTVNQAMEDNIHLGILLWNEDPKDWAAGTPAQVVQAVDASAQPGGIVDMHDIYHVTADALPQVITNLTGRGYHFVTVDQLLDLSPSSRGIYYGFRPH